MLGQWEWLIILLIVLLLFGVGRISQVFEELGKGIRAFREGLQGEGETANREKTDEQQPPASSEDSHKGG